MAKDKTNIWIAVLISVIVLVVLSPFIAFGVSLVKETIHIREEMKTYPQPEITYGEFPFEIVYELDGKEIVYQDTYVCEYEGSHWNLDMGHYRQWKGYLKSNGEEYPVFLTDGAKEIICLVGSPEYYMDDQKYTDIQTYSPRLDLIRNLEGGGTASPTLWGEQVTDYPIRLISWKLSEPIENSFK